MRPTQGTSARQELSELADSIKRRFLAEKRVLSYDEYLEELLAHPVRHSRDAARYLRDCFDHYGSYEVPRPWGPVRRFRLFDQEFGEQADGAHVRLIGHEELQNGFYRALSNFVREGRANRLVLLHGPNGSAKSTFADCIMRALEHYSMTDDGALYRFSWVFSRRVRGAHDRLRPARAAAPAPESYAHLETDKVSAKLPSELREHPLLLLPIDERRELLARAYAAGRHHGVGARLDLERQARPQERGGLRRAARELRRRPQARALARAGRALLHLAPLPHRRGHHRPADERRRRRAADHRGPHARRAAGRAQLGHAVRDPGRAGRRRRAA